MLKNIIKEKMSKKTEKQNRKKKKIQQIEEKKNNKIKFEEEIEYETLLPKDNIKNKTEFMLDYAINKDKVNNIAVTGGYSTGKSSIINSYFKNKQGVKVISLATFKQKKDISKIVDNSKKKIV